MSDSRQLVILSLIFYGVMTALAIGLCWILALPVVLSLPGQAVQDGLAGVASGLIIVVLTRILNGIPSFARFSSELEQVVAGQSTAQVLLLAVLSSTGEELLFRGALQSWLVRYFSSTWGTAHGELLGLGLASLGFACMHVGRKLYFLWWTAFALVVGLWMGGLLLWTGGLLAPILTHFTVNFLNLRHLSRRGGERTRYLTPIDPDL